jgi:hypothetical protein
MEIQIDVHPARETRPTRHTHPTLSPCMVLDRTYLTRSMHSNLTCSHQQSWAGSLLPRNRAPNTIHSTLADRSVGPYPVSLPRQPLKQWGQSQSSIDDRLLVLPDPYLWHVIGTFNTCSWGPTHRSLTDMGGGYNLRDTAFPHHTPDLSNRRSSTFHLRALPSLRLSIQQLQIELEREQTLNLASGSLHSTSIIIYHLSIAWANDVSIQ